MKKTSHGSFWRVLLGCSSVGAFAILFWCAQGAGAETTDEKTAVGSETCLSCHQEIGKHFKNEIHATVNLEEDLIPKSACESCHGLGSKHAESGGKRKFIERNHTSRNCLSCHTDILAKLKLQHHHPVIEGRVECSDCHGSHGTDSRSNTLNELRGSDDKCFKCHKTVQGPYVFEHDAMQEGCTACHEVHGSVQDKMLIAGQSTTCLRCHYDVTTNPSGNLSGGVGHGGDASAFAGGGNFDIGRGEECVDHHRAPHGSNIWRTLNR